MKRAFAVAERFEATGKSAAIFSVHTLKPLDRETLIGILGIIPRRRHRRMRAERQSGHARKELAWITGALPARHVYAQDAFIHCYGSHDDILDAHGLATEKICAELNL